ncbi:tyrosine-type recombinase/integrase [Roseibium aggregatum]|uniref:Integrase arm-type DNA-binding domain-containing protein n=1 Tax=Roseibium aggregatum TaxID=187304 RepID=A0A926NW46_9HYPH|nr:site-specific integrase [Roseibium aggregatum]MBD1544893.1 integrase arm-type DNA-binding domain-containing protein [Roseibium aggregatum]
MARTAKRLSARAVQTLSKAGLHADGDGLYLSVKPTGAKSWLFIFQWDGKRKEMGLGKLSAVSLADARESAGEARTLVAKGVNPIEQRKAEKAKNADQTFGSFADALIDDLAPGFRNQKHIAQWRMTLKAYAAPLRPKRLDEIDTAAVLSVLQPIWQTKPETANRLRGRLERVLDAAKAKGLRSGENPARWRGHLDSLLPKRQKLKRGHHAAMPYKAIPDFMDALRANESLSALALEWCILTATRSGETLNATWSEIDRQNGIWTIPAQRMKGGREHRVPLTDCLTKLLDRLALLRREDDYLFPGTKKSRPLSGMSMAMQLRRMGQGGFTVHGFRSAFRDWTAEETSFPREIAEAALAHVFGDATERAYRRGDALERRRDLMAAWESHCDPESDGNIIVLRNRFRVFRAAKRPDKT